MNLTSAIEAYNESSEPKIELGPRRDGSWVANLPRVGREIRVEGSQFSTRNQVTAADVALLCEEARRAIAPGLALLDAALAAFGELKVEGESQDEDEEEDEEEDEDEPA